MARRGRVDVAAVGARVEWRPASDTGVWGMHARGHRVGRKRQQAGPGAEREMADRSGQAEFEFPSFSSALKNQ
jgi:hypothetical protein